MTLPGINRTIARNIVNHRQAIGQFHRVEDLALVSGVGAHKLELVRPEVCVLFGNMSWNSSEGSICSESLGIPENLLDINSASVFALQGIPGLNQVNNFPCIGYQRIAISPVLEKYRLIVFFALLIRNWQQTWLKEDSGEGLIVRLMN